jgi:F0F1-type ATP synthase membrane subunit b/b'
MDADPINPRITVCERPPSDLGQTIATLQAEVARLSKSRDEIIENAAREIAELREELRTAKTNQP